MIFVDYSRSIGDFHVHQRIILISNGRPTDYIDIDSDSPPLTGSSEVLPIHCTANNVFYSSVTPVKCKRAITTVLVVLGNDLYLDL